MSIELSKEQLEERIILAKLGQPFYWMISIEFGTMSFRDKVCFVQALWNSDVYEIRLDDTDRSWQWTPWRFTDTILPLLLNNSHTPHNRICFECFINESELTVPKLSRETLRI